MNKETTDVIVIGELSHGEIASHTFELITLAHKLGSTITCVLSVSGSRSDFDCDAAASELGGYGANSLHCVDCGPGLSGAALARYVTNLSDAAVGAGRDVVVLSPQTYLGRDVSAHVSVFADRALLANAINVEVTGDGITTTHMVFGGSKIATAQSTGASPHVVVVRPKSITPDNSHSATCELVRGDASELIAENARTQIVSSETISSDGPELEDAAIVVTGGRGLGSQENYETLVQACADVLGGASGASRAIVDAGWVPYSKQVGQTGKTVKPNVYIACGVSGATQHLVGMKGSKNIIAINIDDQAPIFSVADLGVVADVNVVLPQLIEKLRARG